MNQQAKLFSAVNSLLGYIESAKLFGTPDQAPSAAWMNGLTEYANRVEKLMQPDKLYIATYDPELQIRNLEASGTYKDYVSKITEQLKENWEKL